MIAKLGHGANIFGVLSYNHQKVNTENGQILFTNKMRETTDGKYSVAQLFNSFEPYLVANKRTEKPVLHISLNPDPKDKVNDETFVRIAKDYMGEMGYGEQPFVVFKHTDIDRPHIHIVSVNVTRNGKKIKDSFEKQRSMKTCRQLEKQYRLIPATERQSQRDNQIFKPVDYKKGDVKSQIAAVVRYLPRHYQFQTLGAYNALLSLFNITAEEVKGAHNDQPKHGLVYVALNEKGEKVSNPFKSSLFGKTAGIAQLQQHFEQSKTEMKTVPARNVMKSKIAAAMNGTTGEEAFKKQLLNEGMYTVIRRNDAGRIYGITFIDQPSRTVWNGSQLGKEFSANVFNDLWSGKQPDTGQTVKEGNLQDENRQAHSLFHFLPQEITPEGTDNAYGLIESIGGLLPQALEEDYEELAFENEVKKRKRRNKKSPKN